MKITSLDKEIKKVFETGYYQVPRFQRPYSWEKDNVTEFWNDTIVDNEADYFIGSIVVYTKNNEVFGIVDGQQRLTTITMILCALRDFYKREKFQSQAVGVHALIEKIDLDNEKSFILQTETSYPYFQEYIQKFDEPDVTISYSPEEVSLKNAFEQITGYVDSIVKAIKLDNTIDDERKRIEIQLKLNEIRDKLLRLKVIYIELDNEDDAYLIFETLNTRGKDLEVSDLVKNYLTKHLKNINKRVDITKDKWNEIRSNVDGAGGSDIDLDSFLLHVWLSKYEATTKKELFKKLKIAVKPADTKEFLNNLLIDSVTYQHIFNPESKAWPKNELPFKSALVALQSFKVVQQTPMVLTILRSYNEKLIRFSQARDLLESIEHFHYIFNAVTSQRSSGGVASIYSTYARRIANCRDSNALGIIVKEFRQKLRERVPTYEEFLVNFKELRFVNDFIKQRRIIHYTLSKIDKKFNVTGVDIAYDTMTIEHLVAQKPIIRIPDHDKYVGMVGNLVLLNEKSNGALSNKDFVQKKSAVLGSNIFLDKILKTSGQKWDKNDIEERTEELAHIAYNQVFKI